MRVLSCTCCLEKRMRLGLQENASQIDTCPIMTLMNKYHCKYYDSLTITLFLFDEKLTRILKMKIPCWDISSSFWKSIAVVKTEPIYRFFWSSIYSREPNVLVLWRKRRVSSLGRAARGSDVKGVGRPCRGQVHFLSQLFKNLSSVVVEVAVDFVDSLTFHHEESALRFANQTLVVSDNNHSCNSQIQRSEDECTWDSNEPIFLLKSFIHFIDDNDWLFFH